MSERKRGDRAQLRRSLELWSGPSQAAALQPTGSLLRHIQHICIHCLSKTREWNRWVISIYFVDVC